MKKFFLIAGTVIVIGIGYLGYVVYDAYQNGISQYVIAGQDVGLAGYTTNVVAGAPNTSSATFTERLMPFTVADFPFDAACAVIAPDFARADILTIVASGETNQASKIYDLSDGTCTERTE